MHVASRTRLHCFAYFLHFSPGVLLLLRSFVHFPVAFWPFAQLLIAFILNISRFNPELSFGFHVMYQTVLLGTFRRFSSAYRYCAVLSLSQLSGEWRGNFSLKILPPGLYQIDYSSSFVTRFLLILVLLNYYFNVIFSQFISRLSYRIHITASEYGCLMRPQCELCKSECVRAVEWRTIAWHFKGKLEEFGQPLEAEYGLCETDFLTI